MSLIARVKRSSRDELVSLEGVETELELKTSFVSSFIIYSIPYLD